MGRWNTEMAAGSGAQPAETGGARLDQAVSDFQGHGCHNLLFIIKHVKKLFFRYFFTQKLSLFIKQLKEKGI